MRRKSAVSRLSLISPEPSGFERDPRCPLWPGERYLESINAERIVRSAFLSEGTDAMPSWYRPNDRSFITTMRNSGTLVYELDIADRLDFDAAIAYRRAMMCACCKQIYARDSQGTISTEIGCWFCNMYHQSPFVGSASYESWKARRHADLVRCESYRRSHLAMIERIDIGTARSEAETAHHMALAANAADANSSNKDLHP